ncbi:hypothetical protein PATA110616_07185 [Paenibacillus tarimensis]
MVPYKSLYLKPLYEPEDGLKTQQKNGNDIVPVRLHSMQQNLSLYFIDAVLHNFYGVLRLEY